jgi:hypothetical protein
MLVFPPSQSSDLIVILHLYGQRLAIGASVQADDDVEIPAGRKRIGFCHAGRCDRNCAMQHVSAAGEGKVVQWT